MGDSSSLLQGTKDEKMMDIHKTKLWGSWCEGVFFSTRLVRGKNRATLSLFNRIRMWLGRKIMTAEALDLILEHILQADHPSL